MSFTYDFSQAHSNAAYKGKTTVNTKLFIGGQWVDGSSGKTIDVINPTSGKKVTEISEGSKEGMHLALSGASYEI
jgi:aldehyde dehydrogenase (NAD+)